MNSRARNVAIRARSSFVAAAITLLVAAAPGGRLPTRASRSALETLANLLALRRGTVGSRREPACPALVEAAGRRTRWSELRLACPGRCGGPPSWRLDPRSSTPLSVDLTRGHASRVDQSSPRRDPRRDVASSRARCRGAGCDRWSAGWPLEQDAGERRWHRRSRRRSLGPRRHAPCRHGHRVPVLSTFYQRWDGPAPLRPSGASLVSRTATLASPLARRVTATSSS